MSKSKGAAELLRLWLAMTLFALGPAVAAFAQGRDQETAPVQIVSYARNFLVVSQDPAVASWAASEAEKIRGQVLGEFRWKQKWGKPLVMRLTAVEEVGTRAALWRLIVARIFNHPPWWLQRGLERYFSEPRDGNSPHRDFHPDQLKEVRASGKWLDLAMVLKRNRPFNNPVWEDVFQREAACLVLFLKNRHPEILSAYRQGRGDDRALAKLQDDWTEWIENAHPLLLWQGAPAADMDVLQSQKALARCLRIKVRDGAGKILAGDSVITIADLDSCCKKDLSRRRLLASYGQLVKLARMDQKNISLAQDYVDCANRILAGREFYDAFETLERRRLENTAHQR